MIKPWDLFNYIKNIGHENFKTAGDDVQYLVKYDESEDTVMLIFEESCGKTDWRNNLLFPVKLYKKQTSCIVAAKGWGNAWKSCNDQITNEFIDAIAESNAKHVLICGWSYGGAISLLAAEDLNWRTGIKPDVITFGAPKPLWGRKTQKYVKSCIGKIKQYTHVNDIVPKMPPFLGYKRVSTDKIGKGFNPIKLLNPWKYHQIYGDKSQYKK